MLTKEKLKELKTKDEIENAIADEEDIRTGRIKDREHLKAVDTLLDVLFNLSDSLHYIAESSDIYDVVNERSMEELEDIFKRVREFNAEFDKIFHIDDE